MTLRSSAAVADEQLLTIEQLATATGMSVRNLRSHRTAGLLPPPHVHDRVGYYGPEHTERVRLVQELQAMGFNLRGIKRLLDQTRGDPSQLLSLKRVISILGIAKTMKAMRFARA